MKIIRSTLFLFAAALLFLVRPEPAQSAMPRAAALAKAPAFSGVALDGRAISSAALAGKPYIVNFFASWCPPCRHEIPDMVALQKKYAAKGFTFIGVAVSDSEPSIRAFAAKAGINYPVMMGDDKVIGAFSGHVRGGIRSIPTSFVVNSRGEITEVITGARSLEAFEEKIGNAFGR
ncbi:TlpA disulfide reductase family protein [Chlorobium sp. N1]|uniref:TlpA disulfide reductase family protein n=1 Tax=Chlorobium sp. N1 TaxID=2491138 RepID=UPI00103B39C9|nr:TlpA disulfide reductase family protein [Chlorobium sp. N1]TCD48218.1 TlpA family protein disulfide reductase [Chlorobium sp. N1]